MTKTLILAEKPSAGRAIAAWLAKKHGAARAVGQSHVEVGSYVVTWLFGHVLENFEPEDYHPSYKDWRASDLPIIPQEWKLSPKPKASEQIRAVKSLMSGVANVIGAADPDQEGQLLQDEFLRYIGCRLPTQRLWLSAMDDASIAKSWAAMKPNEKYAGYYWSALARSHADWLTGMNLSRACTLAARASGGNALLPIGRVQTPTLALVVNREMEIENFKPVNYFTPFIQLASTPAFKAAWSINAETDLRVDESGRLLDVAIAKSIAKSCEKAAVAQVLSVVENKGKEHPPLPFSLSSLQEHLSRSAGIGVQDTLNIAQSLYEKKLTSYPRTDCEYLPESQHAEAADIVSVWGADATKSLESSKKKANLALRSRAFNDKNVSAHHAIVPRPVSLAQLNSLDTKELLVWVEVAKRYLLQFFPAAEFMNTEIVLACAEEQFKATGKVYSIRGWKDAFEEALAEVGSEPVSQPLPRVSKGDVLKVSAAGYDSTTTKPPKRYTEGTLVAAMKAVHRYVSDPALKAVLRENVGIGTEATRASTIAELFRREFIVAKKNQLSPTSLARNFITTLPKQITAPDMTALWQQDMDDMRVSEERGYKEFMLKQASWLADLVAKAPTWFVPGSAALMSTKAKKSSVEVKTSTHKCSACSAELKHINAKYGWFFSCSNEKCKATYKDVGGVPVAKAAPAASGAKAVIGEHTESGVCPKCKKGKLLLMTCGPHTKSPGKQFLSCSAFAAAGKAKCDFKVWPK